MFRVKFMLAITNLNQLHYAGGQKTFWSVLFLLLASFISYTLKVSAQISPDNTLPNNSIVTPNGDVIEITGGTTAGNNLFHSFQDFSVLNGQTAFFNNELTIDNILSRITGNSVSNIDGLIRANGGANLFLINPNGIIFGENASLDIGGSFVATTADAIRLGEDGFFSAGDPQNSQLLSVQPEVLFENALANNQGTIINRGNLAVAENLTLFANNLDLQGNLQAGNNLTLQATDTIQILGTEEQPFLALAGVNLVVEGDRGINIANSIFTSADSNQSVDVTFNSLEDISLTEETVIDVRGADGGSISINAENIEISSGSALLAGIGSNLGSSQSQAGDINLSATEEVIVDEAVIANSIGIPFIDETLIGAGFVENAMGEGGNININTNSLAVSNSLLANTTSGEGNAGKILIDADDKVQFDGENTSVRSIVNFNTQGNSEGIEINTGSLGVANGAVLSSSTNGQGDAGDLFITASESLELMGNGFEESILPTLLSGAIARGITPSEVQNSILTFTTGTGAAGDLTIDTKNLILQNGALISSSTFGQGVAGKLTLTATEKTELISSGLFAATLTTGAAGDLTIDTGNLIIRDGTLVSTSTFGEGDGGDLIVRASESVEMTSILDIQNPTGLFSNTVGGTGKAGNIAIDTKNLILRDGTQVNSVTGTSGVSDDTVSVIPFGGQGGNIIVKASESVELSGTSVDGLFPSILTAESFSGESAGDIRVETENLIIQEQAQIASSTFGSGDAGDLTILATDIKIIGESADSQFGSGFLFAGSTGLFAAVEPGASGAGGNVTIETDNLLLTNGGGISASTSGSGDAGNITAKVNSLEVINSGKLITSTASTSDAGNITLKVQDSIALAGENSGIFSNTEAGSTGNGGSILIQEQTPQTIIIRDGANIAVNSNGSGQGGSITLTAEELTLDNSSITAETTSNRGGNINLNVEDILRFVNDGEITATAGTAQAGGDGGNVTIDSDFILAFPTNNNYQITANAFEGDGGNIQLTTNSFFGSEFVDISASSQFGLEGDVSIEILELDPTKSLSELPTAIVDASRLITQSCLAGGKENEFVITGRGGLPANPNESLKGDAILSAEWVTLPSEETKANQRKQAANSSITEEIIEARGWVVGANGNVILTANPTTANTVKIPWLIPHSCAR